MSLYLRFGRALQPHLQGHPLPCPLKFREVCEMERIDKSADRKITIALCHSNLWLPYRLAVVGTATIYAIRITLESIRIFYGPLFVILSRAKNVVLNFTLWL